MAAAPDVVVALRRLAAANDLPRREGASLGGWRWTLRQRLTAVRDALLAEHDVQAGDGWLAARGGAAIRERHALLTRLGALGSRALEDADVGAVRAEVARLVVDLHHHVQRMRDLAYDEVELELGGSD